MQFLKIKKWYLFFAIYSTLPWLFIIPFFKEYQAIREIQNRAELVHAIVFMEPGGIGKTIRIHQHLHQKKAKIIWKTNAEPHTVIIELLVDRKARDRDSEKTGAQRGTEKAKNLEVQKIHNEETNHLSKPKRQ